MKVVRADTGRQEAVYHRAARGYADSGVGGHAADAADDAAAAERRFAGNNF